MQVGDQVGDYRLLREVGKGAFGVVYQAQQVFLGTEVAIKVLLNTTPQERAALLAEAKKIAVWRHPHITQVLGFSEHQTLPYLVLQYAPHGTLKDHYPLGQTFSLQTILPHVQQIAEGLQFAHDQQMLHLDLKPSNVLLYEHSRALLSDFGISVILHEQQTHKSLTNFAGTPAYAAPEQLQQKPNKASDQYALATMVYQWLTGRMPFTGDIWALGFQKISQDPPPLGGGVSPEVTAVVLRGLARNPKDRYPSLRDFAQALVQLTKLEDQEQPYSLLFDAYHAAGVEVIPVKESKALPPSTEIASFREALAALRAATKALEEDRAEERGFLDGSKDAIDRLEDWTGKAMGLNLRQSPDHVRRYLPLSILWVITTRQKKFLNLLKDIIKGFEKLDSWE